MGINRRLKEFLTFVSTKDFEQESDSKNIF